VRVLFYTGRRFNFYDVIVTALDGQVLKEQVEKGHQTNRPECRNLRAKKA